MVTQATYPPGAAARLPQEIIDIIVNHYHSDKRTISVLALVSWPWLRSARRHIFARVGLRELYSLSEVTDELVPFDPFWRFHFGLEVITRSPAIASCIRFVKIKANHDQQYLVTQGFQFLSLLPNLRSLSLINIHWLNLNPNNVPTILTGISAVAPTLEQLSLTTVTFADPADLALFVRAFLKIKRVSFAFCEWDVERRAPTMTPTFAFRGLSSEPPVETSASCLEHIDIHDCPPQAILEVLLQLKLDSLKGVKICWDTVRHLTEFALPVYKKFFDVIGNNLQSINLGVRVMDSQNPDALIQLLTKCRKLSSFSIDTCYRQRHRLLVWFQPILEAVATSALEEFTIYCQLYLTRESSRYISWERVDDTLSDAARVPRFRKLNVAIGKFQETQTKSEASLSSLGGWMPRLMHARMLSILKPEVPDW